MILEFRNSCDQTHHCVFGCLDFRILELLCVKDGEIKNSVLLKYTSDKVLGGKCWYDYGCVLIKYNNDSFEKNIFTLLIHCW